MKKYIVRNKNTNEVFGKFDTKVEANKKLIEYITERNVDTYRYVFDFEIKEEEIQEINSYEDAKKYLGLSDISQKSLLALTKLLVIAKAWNEQDGFAPDFSNEEQEKYFPCFVYKDDTAGFVCTGTNWATTDADVSVISRLCFATKERAEAFGKQFQDLYNDFY